MTDSSGGLIIDVQDTTLDAEDREILAHPHVGGLILFARNYESRTQLLKLCLDIRACRNRPLLIMTDQEGGRVQRFITEFTRLPEMNHFGELYKQDPNAACQSAYYYGKIMAAELLSMHIDLSLAPILDLNRGVSHVIGTRAFHADPEVVITLATAFINGMHKSGMAATGKHFPGHGSIIHDSHITAATDERSLNTIMEEDMKPFAALIHSGLNAVMASHILFPNVDHLPVGYSHFWLQEILRSRLKFNGPILTDDLSMEGANISSHYIDRVIAAREAGCDFTLLCNNRQGVISVLDQLSSTQPWVSKERFHILRGKFSYPETMRLHS